MGITLHLDQSSPSTHLRVSSACKLATSLGAQCLAAQYHALSLEAGLAGLPLLQRLLGHDTSFLSSVIETSSLLVLPFSKSPSLSGGGGVEGKKDIEL